MSRATNAVARKRRKKKVLKQAKGYFGRKHSSYRLANPPDRTPDGSCGETTPTGAAATSLVMGRQRQPVQPKTKPRITRTSRKPQAADNTGWMGKSHDTARGGLLPCNPWLRGERTAEHAWPATDETDERREGRGGPRRARHGLRGPWPEADLDRQLHLPLDRAAERARRARQHRRDRAVGGVANDRVRVTELRVIENVERLDANLGRSSGRSSCS